MVARFAKSQGITLVGGGVPSRDALARALTIAPHLVAADGGADAALGFGFTPDLAVGDFDSISESAREVLGADRLHHNPDQETTDFDKVLAAVEAPLLVAVGFSGGRMDHTLAAISTMAQNPHRRLVMDTGEDLCLICPPALTLTLPAECRVSLYPLAPVRCASTGLSWATDHHLFDPLGRIGTSNAAKGGPVTLHPAGPQMLLMLPLDQLGALTDGWADAPLWPAPARAQ
ncbi:thiamine diphosphokinase [Pararhodobacter zhoushanensis]|uniref:thiamine diphosphokinase n=1 Tax=Pararhodobacter zhoushanensis TaxID=2479545 RepID=UPI000F8DA022|nr:thiamine diphosphokinase [Pararhodobacter zhoushanensis]